MNKKKLIRNLLPPQTRLCTHGTLCPRRPRRQKATAYGKQDSAEEAKDFV